jgi:protein ImuB
MFACVHIPGWDGGKGRALVELAYAFSPKVEATFPDTVVADMDGTHYLFGPAEKLARRMAAEARRLDPGARVAVAANPDAAIHAAHGFPGINLIPEGEEGDFLGFLPLDCLLPALASVDEKRAAGIRETLRSWGICRFREFAALPVPGLAERLGPEGVRLQALARGGRLRSIVAALLVPGFDASIDLETPVDLLEPLLFLLGRLVHQVCAALQSHALSATELCLELKLSEGPVMPVPVRLALPMRDPRLFLKLLEVELLKRPPEAPVTALSLSAVPARPRALQKGLFTPAAPEPARLEFLIARLEKLLGSGSVGAVELIDTHRPDAFRMKRFTAHSGRRPPAGAGERRPPLNPFGYRVFRPPLSATVETENGNPLRLLASRSGQKRVTLRGRVSTRAGPYRTSGNWWDEDRWARDEWDVGLSDGGLYCIYRELEGGAWFVAGSYD